MIFGIYAIWVKIFIGIEYKHYISLYMRMICEHVTCGIFGIPEVNFSVGAFKLGMLRDLEGTCDISSRFCQIPICVFVHIVFLHIF